jgi:hypothetical protein
VTEAIGGRDDELVSWLTAYGASYAEQVRDDHARFVEAFRAGAIGVTATV